MRGREGGREVGTYPAEDTPAGKEGKSTYPCFADLEQREGRKEGGGREGRKEGGREGGKRMKKVGFGECHCPCGIVPSSSFLPSLPPSLPPYLPAHISVKDRNWTS